MNVNPGELKQRIEIVRMPDSMDEDGYPVGEMQQVLKCWAKFSRTSGKEVYKANADYADVSVRFMIRHTSKSLDNKMSVLYNGDRYDIRYINEYNDSHEYIELMAEYIGVVDENDG